MVSKFFFSICEKRAGDQARLAAIIVKAFGHFFFPDHQHLQLLSLWPNIANTGFNVFWSFLLIDTLNMHMINQISQAFLLLLVHGASAAGRVVEGSSERSSAALSNSWMVRLGSL